MLYQLLFNTHYFLIYTSYIFIFLYVYIILYVYLYIFLQLTLQFPPTVFSYGYLFLRFSFLYSCLPYGRLPCTVPSTSFYTVNSTIFYTIFYTVTSIQFSLLLFSTYSIIFSLYSSYTSIVF